MKVMLVDDEELAVMYLEQMIDWEKNGYQIVGCAASGRQALELYERYRPEIVISDIRMPGMDGLELTRRLKEKNQDVAVILMSAYKDFEYAKKGIEYGVSNYLLKHELEERTILKELDAVRKKWEKAARQKKVYQRHLLSQLISGQKAAEEMKESYPGNRLFLLLVHKNSHIANGKIVEEEWSAQEKEAVKKIFAQTGQERCAYVSDIEITGDNWIFLYQLEAIASKYTVNCLIEQKSMQSARKLSACLGVHIQILYSYEIALDEIGSTFRKIAWQIRYAWFRESGRAYAVESLQKIGQKEKKPLGDRIKDLRNALEEGEPGPLVRQWFAEIEREKQLESFKELMPFLEQLLLEKGETEREEEKKLWTIEEAGQYYADCFDALRKQLRERDTKNYSRLVRDVMRYLQSHYSEDVSLDALGEIFQMNGAYLGQMVRKETGNTILKHVTNLRMEKAKHLLRKKNYTVAETAYGVGYQTSQYFSQIFTRTVGVSPQEYKRWEEKN